MKLLRWLDKNVEYVVLAIMLCIMCVLSFANVITRYIFHHALSWSDEICCYLLTISAFYCLPCAVRNNLTLKVDTFTNMLPKKIQRIIEILCNVAMVLILGYLLYGTTILIDKADLIHQTSPALGIPVSLMYRAMALGLGLGIFRYVQKLFCKNISPENGKKGE